MRKYKSIKSITGHQRIDGMVPGVKGQRAFPTYEIGNIDPFIMLDHIGPQTMDADYYMNGAAHPHRGFETITFMFEGVMHHVDSLGNKLTLESGSVQRMNAGKGIMHGGDMTIDSETLRFHEVQLWLNVPATKKMSEPEIQNADQQDIPVVHKNNYNVRVIAGEYEGSKGPIEAINPVVALHITSSGKSQIEIGEVPVGFESLIYILEGEVIAERKRVDEHHTIRYSEEGDAIALETPGEAQLLVLFGKPINEPIAMGGPFVMNTQEEIRQAHADFNAGLFGTVEA